MNSSSKDEMILDTRIGDSKAIHWHSHHNKNIKRGINNENDNYQIGNRRSRYGTIFGIGATFAQDSEDGAATFGDDARYVRVTFVSYKPGKAGEAYRILREHYAPAGEAAGLEGPVAIHFQTGPFDAAYHWRLENGMSDLEWVRSPNNVKFRAASAELEGSEEAAQAVMDSYNTTIARIVRSVGHRHVSDDEE